MKIRIPNKKAVLLIVYFIIYYKFFYLIPLSGTLSDKSNTVMTALITDIWFAIYVSLKKDKRCKGLFDKYVISYMAFMIAEFFYSVIKYYREPILEILKGVLPSTSLLFYILLIEYTKKNFKIVMKIIIGIATIGASILILQAIVYNGFGIAFLHTKYLESVVYRTFGIRILGVDAMDFSPIFSIGYLFVKDIEENEKKLCIFNIILVFVYQIFVAQTRTVIAILAIILIITVLVSPYKSKWNKVAVTLFTFIIVFLIVEKILSAFGWTDWQDDYSYYHRFETIIYYFEKVKKNPFFGLGLISVSPTYIGYTGILSGNRGYSVSDVGIVGVLASRGIIGGVFYIILIQKMYRHIKINGKIDVLNFSIFLTTVVTCINLSLFDGERIFLMILLMLIYDANYYNKLNGEKRNIDERTGNCNSKL